MTSTSPLSYRQSWDGFWRDLSETSGEALWDVSTQQGSEQELRLFLPDFDPELPVVDFGCGNGTHTILLAKHCRRVIGIDVSAEAVRGAAKKNGTPNIEYHAIDILDSARIDELHRDLGDANVFVRGVIHQLRPADRLPAMRSLAKLMGTRGCAYLVELGVQSDAIFQTTIAGLGGLPPKIAVLAQHGIIPGGLAEGELQSLIKAVGLQAVAWRALVLHSTLVLPNGKDLAVPGDSYLVRPAAA